MKLEVLRDQWAPYFQSLEVGALREPAEIVTHCHVKRINMPVVHGNLQPQDLPSMLELEDFHRLVRELVSGVHAPEGLEFRVCP